MPYVTPHRSAREEAPDGTGHVAAVLDRGDQDVDGVEGRVGLTSALLVLHLDAGSSQGRGVGVSFVAERVELGGEHGRRCEFGERVGEERRGQR